MRKWREEGKRGLDKTSLARDREEEGERERDIVERAIQWLHHNKGEPRAPAIYRPLYQTTMRGWGNFF